LAYSLEFTRQAARELEAVLRAINESEKRSFQRAFEALQTNPYPTNTSVTPGTIRRLRGSSQWRFKVSYSYRIRYSIRETIVIVDRVRHRKDVYRD
jgi:mRNA-degrading endonuclease RelE of RelBE toxin-antitoxin system